MHNLKFASKFSVYYPKFAKILKDYNYKKRHNNDTHFDTAENATAIRNAILRKFESLALANYSAQFIIKNMSVQFHDLIISCYYNPMNIRNFQISQKGNRNFAIQGRKCTDVKEIVESIFEGKKCFTFFSALQDNLMAKKDNLKIHGGQNLDVTVDDCRQVHGKFECAPETISPEIKHLLKGTEEKMIYDLNPNIRILIKSLENDIWHAYVNEPITITGIYSHLNYCLKLMHLFKSIHQTLCKIDEIFSSFKSIVAISMRLRSLRKRPYYLNRRLRPCAPSMKKIRRWPKKES